MHQELNNNDDQWERERVKALIGAAEDAIRRTRWVFLLLNFGCITLLSTQLNLYFPWIRHVRERIAHLLEIKVDTDYTIVVETLDKLIWDGLYTVSLPLLGLKYSADDIIVLGTAAMSVLALWSFYAHRRENHCLGMLHEVARKNTRNAPLISYIYAAIAHHFVFTTTTRNDGTWGSREKPEPMAYWHLRFLDHLPWLSSLLTVLVMLVSLYIPGWILVPVVDRERALYFQMDFHVQVEAWLRVLWGAAWTFVTLQYCLKCRRYEDSTRALLVEIEYLSRCPNH